MLAKQDTESLGFIPTEGLKFHSICGGVFTLRIHESEHPIGFCVCAPGKPNAATTSHIYMLYIHPIWRGRGFGRMLLTGVEKTMKDKGATAVECYVRQNLVANQFWIHMGYSELPARTGGKARGHAHNHYRKEFVS